ncbi:MAG: hypothetical protein J5809_08855 [Selenomonadaceae bacterium]|nr:hypothetical protein [Selenomonadaceae bacterium]
MSNKKSAPWTARGPSQVAGSDLCGPVFFASVSFSKEMLKQKMLKKKY